MGDLAILEAMTAPAALITACSLFLLGVYDKYSKVVASLRTLNSERRHLFGTGSEIDVINASKRESEIEKEWPILRSRLSNTLNQMRLIAIAAGLFLLAALSIGASHFCGPTMSTIAVILVSAGIISMLVAMTFAFHEAELIAAPIDLETPETTHDRALLSHTAGGMKA